jgi:predicted DNA-binding antitoxin AbrB/MazE fold protein
MVIHAIYANGVFRPIDPIDLPENSQVQLSVGLPKPGDAKSPLSRLADVVAEFPENPELPIDMAAQHDHYLYGTPKRP